MDRQQQEIRWLLEEKYGGLRTKEFEEDLKKLEAGEHIAYLIGFVEFLGARIDLSLRPLIPRPETEFWTEQAIAELQKRSGTLRIMDAFAGSGSVGVAFGKHVPNALVEFLEKDSRMREEIQKNLDLNNIDERRALIVPSDVFSGASGEYDAILANPPYVDEKLLTDEEREALSREPKEALFAPEDGFFFVREVLENAPKFLKPGGVLYCEMQENHGPRAQNYANLYREFGIGEDQYGKPRFIRAVW